MFFRMVYKSGQIFLPFCHNTRVWQTDGRTDGQTEFSSQCRVCITCSAVITIIITCVVGSRALIATETTDNELNTPAGEWASDVFNSSTSNFTTACLIFDIKFGSSVVRIELIYKDVNNTTQKASLFDRKASNWVPVIEPIQRNRVIALTDLLGTFEFHLQNVSQYQVCIFWHWEMFKLVQKCLRRVLHINSIHGVVCRVNWIRY